MIRSPDDDIPAGTSDRLVLVTGGSGFIASHCILQLLAAGYSVRTTIRSPDREPAILNLLHSGGAAQTTALSFAQADLLSDKGWDQAAAGCTYVLHVASPFPPGAPKREDDLIIPARDGALRVLRAARAGGVKRVVLTSSFAAIGYGHAPTTRPFTEEDWTNLDGPGLSAYVKSKTLAEQAAWEFISREGNGLELSVVNPVGVFGPVLGNDYSTSILLVRRLMDGSMPRCPRLSFGIVDVRDVADLHLRAMTNREAANQRFLAIAGNFMAIKDMAAILKARMGRAAKRVPTGEMPNWLVRVAGVFDPAIAQIVPELGKQKNATAAKAKRMLGWTPRSKEDAILATAESLVQLGLIRAN